MKASTILSALIVLVFFVSVSSGIRYTVNFSGLVGRLCGDSSNSPSGCPDPSPCYVSSSPTAIPSGGFPSGSASGSINPTATASTNPTATASGSAAASSSSSGSASASTGQTATASPSLSASIGQTATASPTATASLFPSGVTCPTQSTCPIAPSCSPCLCATPSSFPSFTRTPSPTSAASLSQSAGPSSTSTRSISASLTASPSPNPCGPQYEASTTNSFGVGLLFDRTTWARDNSNPAVYGALYAINQINAAGGIRIGNRNISLQPIFYDTQGLPNNTVEGANSLTRISCASVLIGTENGAQRRAVESAILDSTAPSNAAPGLLLNPQNWEGIDVNAGVINFGANLLNNVRRGLDWAYANNRTHIHLLGSDDVDSRIINAYARQYLAVNYPSVLIIGEDYMASGASQDTASQIFEAPQGLGASLFNNAVGNPCPNGTACTLLLSSVFGQAANRVLFAALAARYLTPTNGNTMYLTMSVRNSQYEFFNFSGMNVNNQIMGTNYLDQVDAVSTPNIASWKSGLVAFLQTANIINDTARISITTGVELRSYNAIRLWANAVAAAGTANPAVIRNAITNATFNAPNGLVSVNATSRIASTATVPFYVSRLTTPPLRGVITTALQTTYDSVGLYPNALVGNLTTADSFSSLVNGIRSYYLNSQSAALQSISLGWELPAFPSATSK